MAEDLLPSRKDLLRDDEPLARPGELALGLAGHDHLQWATADLTEVVEEARRCLDLSPLAAVAMGRALAAAALLFRFSTKAPGRLVLEILGDGPLGRVVAEVDERGGLRGLVGEPRLATPADGTLSLKASIGKGSLRVTREGDARRYTSEVELVSGEIGKDLAHYLHQSEQIHSAVLLGVLPRPDGIGAAGGILVEALPGATEGVIARLEANIAALEGVSRHLEEGGIRGLNDAVLAGFDRQVLERHPLAYRCGCNRESLRDKLLGLAASDIASVTDDQGRCEAVCAFCGARYVFTAGELLPQ